MSLVDKIMSIYYGEDRLPYKDIDREVHYPIGSGNIFTGENNTTKFRFYVDRIGGSAFTWLATVKLPDGTLVYRLTSSVSSSGYVELDISSFYTTVYGAIFVGLTGYDANNVIIEEDDDTYSISGNPDRLVTGSVKVMVNYAPQVLNIGSDLTATQLQEIFGAIAGKMAKKQGIPYYQNLFGGIGANEVQASELESNQVVFDISSGSFYKYASSTFKSLKTNLIVCESIASLGNLGNYTNKQMVFLNSASEKKLYEIANSSTTLVFDFNDYYTKSQIDTSLASKLDKVSDTKKVYATSGSGLQTTISYDIDNTRLTIPVRDGSGNIQVGSQPYFRTDATSKDYVDNKVGAEATTRQFVDNQLQTMISTINGKIPSQATIQNQLADKAFVNSTVSSLAAFYITSNAQGDPFATKAALDSATVFYSGGEVRVPSRNDYCLVNADETHGGAATRYIYQNAWQFQFVVNDTPFTATQLAAINSGITAVLVGKISEIDTKQNQITYSLDEPVGAENGDVWGYEGIDTSDVAIGNGLEITETSGGTRVLTIDSDITATKTDLSDYYTKSQVDTSLTGKQNTITSENKLSASLVSGLSTVATSGSYNDLDNKPHLYRHYITIRFNTGSYDIIFIAITIINSSATQINTYDLFFSNANYITHSSFYGHDYEDTDAFGIITSIGLQFFDVCYNKVGSSSTQCMSYRSSSIGTITDNIITIF